MKNPPSAPDRTSETHLQSENVATNYTSAMAIIPSGLVAQGKKIAPKQAVQKWYLIPINRLSHAINDQARKSEKAMQTHHFRYAISTFETC